MSRQGDPETKRANRRAAAARRRARLRGAEVEKFDHREIFERDGWTCGICEEPVDPALEYPHPMSASLDHIVPLSKHGNHVRSNVQCAHFLCNSLKADRVA